MPPSCARLGGFAIGARDALLWQHYGNARQSPSVIRQAQRNAAIKPSRVGTLANTIELVLPSARPSPQSKQQIHRFSRFCTAHGRKSLYFTMGDSFAPKLPILMGIWTPSNARFLGHVRAHNPNSISIGSAVLHI